MPVSLAVDGERARLCQRLADRRAEIEEAVYTRVRGHVARTPLSDEATYSSGLRTAVVAAVTYGLEALHGLGSSESPLPHEVLEQARRTARANARLDAVLLRCVAGHACMGSFIVDEGERSSAWAMGAVHEAHSALLEGLLAAVAAEYNAERLRMSRSQGQQQMERVRRLLAGQAVDARKLDYDLNAWHMGLIATGTGVRAFVQRTARALSYRAFAVYPDEATGWIWLPAQLRHPIEEIQDALLLCSSSEISVAVGEPDQRLHGFRLTHQQAQEAMLVGARSGSRITRYADVLLLAAVLRDPAFARSLARLFLTPLDDASSRDRDVLRQTLRAYFASGHNVKAAAAALGVDRGTARKRLATVEQRLGRLLTTCQAELDIALRLDELEGGVVG